MYHRPCPSRSVRCSLPSVLPLLWCFNLPSSKQRIKLRATFFMSRLTLLRPNLGRLEPFAGIAKALRRDVRCSARILDGSNCSRALRRLCAAMYAAPPESWTARTVRGHCEGFALRCTLLRPNLGRLELFEGIAKALRRDVLPLAHAARGSASYHGGNARSLDRGISLVRTNRSPHIGQRSGCSSPFVSQ
jgi:hypothetical protein